MITVFADTAFYVALLSSRDALHSRAVQFLAEYSGRIVTTEFILLEVANFNARPADRQRFVDLVTQIHNDSPLASYGRKATPSTLSPPRALTSSISASDHCT
jgi:hypothetical protein